MTNKKIKNKSQINHNSSELNKDELFFSGKKNEKSVAQHCHAVDFIEYNCAREHIFNRLCKNEPYAYRNLLNLKGTNRHFNVLIEKFIMEFLTQFKGCFARKKLFNLNNIGLKAGLPLYAMIKNIKSTEAMAFSTVFESKLENTLALWKSGKYKAFGEIGKTDINFKFDDFLLTLNADDELERPLIIKLMKNIYISEIAFASNAEQKINKWLSIDSFYYFLQKNKNLLEIDVLLNFITEDLYNDLFCTTINDQQKKILSTILKELAQRELISDDYKKEILSECISKLKIYSAWDLIRTTKANWILDFIVLSIENKDVSIKEIINDSITETEIYKLIILQRCIVKKLILKEDLEILEESIIKLFQEAHKKAQLQELVPVLQSILLTALDNRFIGEMGKEKLRLIVPLIQNFMIKQQFNDKLLVSPCD